MSEPKIHITTTNSLAAGIDLPPCECPYCKHNTAVHTWVGTICSTCGFDSEQYTGRNTMAIRERMGYSRAQFAQLIGMSKHTIKKYEFGNPSGMYWIKFKTFVADYYNQPQTGEQNGGNKPTN